jgi:MFS family permease
MADRFDRRSVMIIGLLFGAISRIGLGLATGMDALYIIAAFAGFFGQVGWPAQAAMTADLLPEHQRASGFSIQRIVANITWVLGPALGGVLAPVTGYLLLFVLDGLTSFIVAGIVFTSVPETNPERSAGGASIGFVESMAGYGLLLRDGIFMAFLLVSILMTAAYQQMYSALSVYLVRYESLPESFFGMLLMVNAGMVVVLQLVITRWSNKYPPMLVMLGGTALYLVGLTAYGLFSSQALFIGAMVVISLGEMLVMPTGQALVALISPRDMRARYAAAYGFGWIIPQALAPLAAGLVMDNYDPRWVWYGCGLVCAVSILGFWALHLRTGPRIAAVAAESALIAREAVAAK